MHPSIHSRMLSAAIVIVVSFSTLLHAGEADYKGRIKSASAGRIVIATVPDASVTIQIVDGTEITISGKPAGAGDLKPGDFARVSVTDADGGVLKATRIAVSR